MPSTQGPLDPDVVPCPELAWPTGDKSVMLCCRRVVVRRRGRGQHEDRKRHATWAESDRDGGYWESKCSIFILAIVSFAFSIRLGGSNGV